MMIDSWAVFTIVTGCTDKSHYCLGFTGDTLAPIAIVSAKWQALILLFTGFTFE